MQLSKYNAKKIIQELVQEIHSRQISVSIIKILAMTNEC
mgnify:CR=1 FL=1